MLSEEDRQRIEKRLLAERERALELIGEFEQERSQSLQEETGELSSYPLHPADMGSEQMEREKQFLLASQEGRRLYAIDEALRRLYAEPERFGACERCGQGIAVERLEVIPFATLCADCQRESEEGEGG